MSGVITDMLDVMVECSGASPVSELSRAQVASLESEARRLRRIVLFHDIRIGDVVKWTNRHGVVTQGAVVSQSVAGFDVTLTVQDAVGAAWTVDMLDCPERVSP